MSDQPVAVSVLNGEVQVGDRVAYAVRTGSWMGMRIARVLAIEWREHSWKDEQIPVLKVWVEKSTEYYVKADYKTQITELDRVVKL